MRHVMRRLANAKQPGEAPDDEDDDDDDELPGPGAGAGGRVDF